MKNGKVVVVQLIPWISEGGAETLVKDYAININKEKFDVYIVTSLMLKSTSSNLQKLLAAGINVLSPYKFSPLSLPSRIIRYLRNLLDSNDKKENKRAEFVKKTILELRPDVIHVHLQMLKYLYPIANLLDGVKLFYTCHSIPERYFNEQGEKAELDAARFLIQHNNLQLIALHEEMRIELNKMFCISNTIIVRNCVDFSKFLEVDESKEDIRKTLGISKTSLVIGHVGRFTYIKNHEYLVEVFRKVIVQHPDSILLLVGSGKTKKKVTDMLKKYGLLGKSIILPSRGDIPRIMKAMDVFVLPSLFEGLPIVAIEAQVSGLRTIVSNHVTKDILFSENALFLDINEDPRIWADAILNNDIKGNEKNDIHQYDIVNVMRIVEDLYLSVI